MALQGALNAAAPALFAASQHLMRLGASGSVLPRSTTVSSSSGLLARGISSASSDDKKKWPSVKVKPGLRSFAAQPALDDTAMFCFQASGQHLPDWCCSHDACADLKALMFPKRLRVQLSGSVLHACHKQPRLLLLAHVLQLLCLPHWQ